MKLPRTLLYTAVLGGAVFALHTDALAQTTTSSPTASPTATPNRDRSGSGTFRTGEGDTGTYTETLTVVGAVTTDTIIYTLDDSAQTSTDSTTTTVNTDGSRTVVFSHLAFGATAPFTSTTTFAASVDDTGAVSRRAKAGAGSIGTGTYTAADGTSGTLVSIQTRGNQETITRTDFTSAAGILTRELRVTSQGPGSASVRVLTADAANTLIVATLTRFGGRHGGGH